MFLTFADVFLFQCDIVHRIAEKSLWDEVRLNAAQPPLSHTAFPQTMEKVLGRILNDFVGYFLYKVPCISYKKNALYTLISALPVQ